MPRRAEASDKKIAQVAQPWKCWNGAFLIASEVERFNSQRLR
jgi:hypothetical protein